MGVNISIGKRRQECVRYEGGNKRTIHLSTRRLLLQREFKPIRWPQLFQADGQPGDFSNGHLDKVLSLVRATIVGEKYLQFLEQMLVPIPHRR